MDARALGEALLTVAVTPVVSAAMALAVVVGIIALARRIYRQ